MENLVESLPPKVQSEIPKDESVLLSLKGTNKEWLICTDKKLYIIKQGFMTGHTFGGGIYQMPYKNITGVQTEYHMMSGYFEVSAGGMQDTKKDYWGKGQNRPQESPNCVTVTGKPMLAKFRSACDFINEKISESNAPVFANSIPQIDIADQIKKLAGLKDQGILTEEEFVTKKQELLAKL